MRILCRLKGVGIKEASAIVASWVPFGLFMSDELMLNLFGAGAENVRDGDWDGWRRFYRKAYKAMKKGGFSSGKQMDKVGWCMYHSEPSKSSAAGNTRTSPDWSGLGGFASQPTNVESTSVPFAIALPLSSAPPEVAAPRPRQPHSTPVITISDDEEPEPTPSPSSPTLIIGEQDISAELKEMLNTKQCLSSLASLATQDTASQSHSGGTERNERKKDKEKEKKEKKKAKALERKRKLVEEVVKQVLGALNGKLQAEDGGCGAKRVKLMPDGEEKD